MADTPKQSDHTSIKLRIEHQKNKAKTLITMHETPSMTARSGTGNH